MHVASPSPSPVTGTANDYKKVAIQGTKDLLCSGSRHVNLTEESPLAGSDPKAPACARTKAQAEKLILSANTPLPRDDSKNKVFSWEGYLCTGALRFPLIYGTHDPTCIPGAPNALKMRRTNVVLGNANNLWSFCSVQNATSSHLLLARALFDTRQRKSSHLPSADGEALHIHDGEARKFWDLARMIWKFAGHVSIDERIGYLPMWFALVLSSCLEFGFWFLTCGRKRPYQLEKQQVEYALFEDT
ncbi:putative c-3 sterol dehydrogenase c-4 decarboxylase protein [Botrytis fragariae]|uniref:Putative c-3 sterol dehydrogenase c-4 decarboxylase protein n=1 Tax=Botrytis fragariae TaxID=1964551 RepID=A0A8H6AZD8_9HELO|nr:putative c-3 sterol dehydrogenase c-4 decarboxylase protein [Botrytis fragariae]KAF5876519.1 putative c-3 sterol dehydrogenase c-4 decarboxylase protein [Botrytis fragariae]